ncbi:hypothetical protein N182_36470 [Sinorhizobium sp. GL2]|nr:hypothetical protein N182_36470 [Sinorhizobium sp. GL2]
MNSSAQNARIAILLGNTDRIGSPGGEVIGFASEAIPSEDDETMNFGPEKESWKCRLGWLPGEFAAGGRNGAFAVWVERASRVLRHLNGPLSPKRGMSG